MVNISFIIGAVQNSEQDGPSLSSWNVHSTGEGTLSLQLITGVISCVASCIFAHFREEIEAQGQEGLGVGAACSL